MLLSTEKAPVTEEKKMRPTQRETRLQNLNDSLSCPNLKDLRISSIIYFPFFGNELLIIVISSLKTKGLLRKKQVHMPSSERKQKESQCFC